MLLSYLNATLLGWECLFCLVAALTLLESPRGEKRRYRIAMQLAAAAMLGCEIVAWLTQGRPGQVYHWAVVISNLLVYVLTPGVLLLYHRYLCSALLTERERRENDLVQAAELCCYVGVGLAILSQFTGLYYTIDSTNTYVRGRFFLVSMVMPFAGLLMDGILLIRYRTRVSKGLYHVMLAYLLLPLAAAILQAFAYGISYISLSIGGAMLLIYLIDNREQQAQLRQVQQERAVVAQRLEIAQTLNRCVEKLSSGEDTSVAIRDLLWIIKEYFQADRAYIFENDPKRNVTVNTFESVEPGVTPQIENLQEVPMDVISMWMKQFRRGKKYYIAKIEEEKGTPHYQIIKDQDIQKLLTVPLMEQGEVIGFLGVDNPRQHDTDETLLSSLQFFVTNTLRQKKEQAYLQQLSFHDQLTGLYNRNRYNQTMRDWAADCQDQVGILYVDLNGLKRTNDQQGHAAGDLLISSAAQVLEQVFPGRSYRIGGDEFVVICQGIPKDVFEAEARILRSTAAQRGISFSMGLVWKQHCTDLTAALKEADGKMYEEKRKYHRERE